MARQQANRSRTESAHIVGAWASLILPGEEVIKTMERVRWRGEVCGLCGSVVLDPLLDEFVLMFCDPTPECLYLYPMFSQSMGDRELLGALRVTSYRLIFSRYPPMKTTRKAARRTSLTERTTTALSDDIPAYFQLISLPLTTIYKLEFAQRLGSQVYYDFLFF
jgi:hypothetical protein